MKQSDITAGIHKGFKKIDVLFNKIIGRFDMESIHEFRTEIKKLRAFLRLLKEETGDSRFRIPKEIKIFYGYAGTIRNLQLQMKTMDGYMGNPQYTFTEAYMDYLKKIIEKWKENAMEFIGSRNNVHSGEKKVIKNLPGKIKRASGKDFLRHKMNELSTLVKDLPDDDVLHSIRKLLKDISYNWVFVKQYHKLLPPVFSAEEKIKSFTELLGLFLDKRVGIILLETYCKDCEENGVFIEKEIRDLQEIEGGWKIEKQQLGQIIYKNWFATSLT